MEVLIREALPGDYEAYARIMGQVLALHVDWRPDIYRPNDDLFSEADFNARRKERALWVAETEGRVAAVMELKFHHVEDPAHVTRNVLYVEAIAVDEPYRRRGIGRQMVDFLRRKRREWGLDGLELQVNARNRAAWEMYRACGFTEKSVNLELLE